MVTNGENGPTVEGRVSAADVSPAHSKGFDAALDDALDKAGELAKQLGRDTFRVKVNFAADIYVENPGRIQHYIATLTPAG